MFKKVIAVVLTALSMFSIAAGQVSAASEESVSAEAAAETAVQRVSNTLAEDEDALVSTYADQFEQLTYEDAESGLSIMYNLYLPEGYDESASYPMVVFIADSSTVGNDATISLTQGLGALVWASDEWQAANPTIVAVPTYTETVLDDHSGYTTSEYVELTKRFIDYMSNEYSVDNDRIYGTGQSMGCMTTLVLASEYPDLYAACMFVDGQWDVSTLSGLEDQTFVYFAAEDDERAWTGAQEVMAMFDEDGVDYTYAQWDGAWTADELSAATAELFTEGTDRYFISWKTGTITAETGGSDMGSFQGSGAGGKAKGRGEKPLRDKGGFENTVEGKAEESGSPEASEAMIPEGIGGPAENGDMTGMAGGGSSSVHMASFDYAYNCIAVMEWLFGQTR